MGNWNECINIAGLHRLYNTGGMGLQQLSKGVIRKLQNTEAFAASEPGFMDVMCAFSAVDELARDKDYATALELLYDYGDKENRLWIEAETNPQEQDDIPKKSRNPFVEEDTDPAIQKPHYHGPLHTFKGPYATQSGTEWVKAHMPYIIPAPTEPKKDDDIDDDDLEQWDKTKTYQIGDLVRYKNAKYHCILVHSNIDPYDHSHSKPDDPWRWIKFIQLKPFDPALAFTDRLTCLTTGKNYATGRKFKFMSDDEFIKKLKSASIDPPTIPKELYSYWKDSEEPYQDWLIQKWHNHNLTFRQPNTIN